MDWFRLYHGTCTDAKLSLAKAYCGLPRPFVIAAWVAVLEHASSREDRGSLDGLSAELLAVTIDCSVEEAEKLLDAFAKAGLVRDGRVASWDKRQPPSDSSAERTRRWRERKRAREAGSGSGNGGCDARAVTGGGCDVTVTSPEAGVTGKNREEKNRSDSDSESLPSSSSSSPPGETRCWAGESGARADARAAAAAAGSRSDESAETPEEPVSHGPPEPPTGNGLRPDGLDQRLIDELAQRCALMGCPPSRIERTVTGWLASMPPGLVNAVVAKALARARGDPLAYAHRVAAAAMVDLQVQRERAAREDDVPPWLQGYMEAIADGDEEDRRALPH